MEDMDYKNKDIPEEVAPYAKQIFKELRDSEEKFVASAGYMSK